MANPVPNPQFLSSACTTVINQNREIGYNAGRFMQATVSGKAGNLIDICNGLILSHHTLAVLESALAIYPRLLTLEDLVVHSQYSGDWGLSDDARRMAEARVTYFDQIAGSQRWMGQEGAEQ